ncbi:MAG TPA: bifunctional YncE family protein/alkaline phosphatase family protein, partial [Fimbriimonas sp.]|nr:bifunctional YncE family protein/alkaline phosphatase family protein [Fimbriimonas sp.]
GIAYVSNQGGNIPVGKKKTAPSAETETEVDDRGVAKTGSVSIVDVNAGKVTASVEVGLQPADIVITPKHAIVANANSDNVSWIDLRTHKRVRQLVLKPEEKLPFGSMPNALGLRGDRLYVALAGNNALAVIEGVDAKPLIRGFVPTGWYPAAVAFNGDKVLVANNKGVGSRTIDPTKSGRNSHQHQGTVQSFSETQDYKALTQKVRELAFTPQILRAYERQARSTAKPLPIPKRLGDPSTIEHVIYVIKENRTYDQVFGDLPRGDNDASLCTFPAVNSPNHHALATEFVQLDNYYCNGVLSADGHSWATEGNVTPYLERAFGGFNRSYTFGDDPITYSSSGFIWDHILAAGLSFRNYGEMNYSDPLPKKSYKEILAAYARGERVKFTNNIGVERLRRYSNIESPGWNMDIPDQARIDEFLREFRDFEKSGNLPNFIVLYLPQDHLGGPVSSRAHMADNDLAVGRLVEAVSKSRFWPKTALFINEDDPQNGWDHVDGHRSICLVVSPWVKRKALVSEFYNQTSVIRTMLHIFGVPPMNQRDASSNLMAACFIGTPDLTPYKARPANFSLDDSDLKKDTSAKAQYWAEIKKTVPIKRTGMKTEEDEDNLNRFIWHEMKGWNTPYPASFSGPHGRGLKKRKLKHD